MGVQTTSIETYFKEIVPKLNDKQIMVLYAFNKAKRPVNNQEIADFLGKQINTITPRTNELVAKGFVEEAFREIYPKTNRRVIYWRAKGGE